MLKAGQSHRKRVLKLIEARTDRHICFSKRRSGLFEKAHQIAILCGADVSIIALSPSGKPYSFGDPSDVLSNLMNSDHDEDHLQRRRHSTAIQDSGKAAFFEEDDGARALNKDQAASAVFEEEADDHIEDVDFERLLQLLEKELAEISQEAANQNLQKQQKKIETEDYLNNLEQQQQQLTINGHCMYNLEQQQQQYLYPELFDEVYLEQPQQQQLTNFT